MQFTWLHLEITANFKNFTRIPKLKQNYRVVEPTQRNLLQMFLAENL